MLLHVRAWKSLRPMTNKLQKHVQNLLQGNQFLWVNWAFDAFTVCRGLHTVHFIHKSRETYQPVFKCCRIDIYQSVPRRLLRLDKFAIRQLREDRQIMSSEENPLKKRNISNKR